MYIAHKSLNVIFSSGWSFVCLCAYACVCTNPPLLCTRNSQQNWNKSISSSQFPSAFHKVYLDIQIVEKLTTENCMNEKQQLQTVLRFSIEFEERVLHGKKQTLHKKAAAPAPIEPYSYNLFHVNLFAAGIINLYNS